MRKLILLSLSISIFIHCGPKQDKVERYIEDGVEVIVNHLDPYKIKGEPSNLILDKEFTIDTESEEMAEIGLSYILSFDVGSEGSIYFRALKNQDYLVFKFDKNGNFIKRFGQKGQGYPPFCY